VVSRNPEIPLTQAPSVDTESFLDVLKAVASMGKSNSQTVLTTGSPFSGPIGVPITAVAGTVLGALSKAWNADRPVEHIGVQYAESACHAIMAEAALQAVLSMDASLAQEYGVFQKLQDAHKMNQNIVISIASALGPAIIEPALRLAVFHTGPVDDQTEPQFPCIFAGPRPPSPPTANAAQLAQELRKFAAARGEPEQFLHFIDEILSAVRTAGSPDLTSFGPRLNKLPYAGKAANYTSSLHPHFKTIFHRAIFGDAALQAVIDLSSEVRLQEGLHQSIIDTVKKIGSDIMQILPIVISKLEVTIHDGKVLDDAPIVQQTLKTPRQKTFFELLQEH
jgi:hypothetical protein